jgi:phenylacetate-CoA ligase
MFRMKQRLTRSRSLEWLAAIENAPRASREEALAAQFARLSQLLAYAERHVPYYRELFADLRITSRDVRSLRDFAELPVLTKDIVRERQRDLVSQDPEIGPLVAHHSGGSTGAPLRFFHDRRYMDISDAGTYRNLQQAGWTPGDMQAFFWGWNDRLYAMSPWEFELRQWLRRSYQFDPFHADPPTMARWVKKWRQIRPIVAAGYASTVARFAEYVLDAGIELEPLRGVCTTAEKLYPAQRELITRAFGCRVHDCYGSSEVRHIATECARGRMHVNADLVVLEVDRPAAGGAGPAPFIVTSLWAYGMPFIRYRNEDCGALVEGGCSCGSGFPLLDLQISRLTDHFVFPGGRVVHGEFFTHLMYGATGIESFQFHQTAPDRITLWIVPAGADAAGREATVRRAVAEVQSLSTSPVAVDVREVERIPLSSAGKHRFTRSDVPLPAAAARAREREPVA